MVSVTNLFFLLLDSSPWHAYGWATHGDFYKTVIWIYFVSFKRIKKLTLKIKTLFTNCHALWMFCFLTNSHIRSKLWFTKVHLHQPYYIKSGILLCIGLLTLRASHKKYLAIISSLFKTWLQSQYLGTHSKKTLFSSILTHSSLRGCFSYHSTCPAVTKNEVDKDKEKENKNVHLALLSRDSRPEEHKENTKEMTHICIYTYMAAVILHFDNLVPCFSPLLTWTAWDRNWVLLISVLVIPRKLL